MSINLSVPRDEHEMKPRISVVGVGGAGGNAVNNMIRSNLIGCEVLICNTNAQPLMHNLSQQRIQLGVSDLMVMPGLINLDFADIRAVMGEMGKAMMGTGEAEGDRRAIDAAEAAISNPLLEDVSMKGARGVLINITGGADMTLFEVDEAANRIREDVDPEANIIFGSTFDEKLPGRMRISAVATGIDVAVSAQPPLLTLVADRA